MKTLEAKLPEDKVIIPDTWIRYLFPVRGETTKKQKIVTPEAARKTILKLLAESRYQKFEEAEALLEKPELSNSEMRKLGQLIGTHYYPRRLQLAWADWFTKENGLLATLQFAIDEEDGAAFKNRRNSGLFTALRKQLSAASDAVYEKALKLAEESFSYSRPSACKLSFLFPEKRDWHEGLVEKVDYANAPWLLVNTDNPDLAKPILRHFHLHTFTQDWCSNLYVSILHNMGLKAGPLLADFANRIHVDADGGKKLAQALACIPCTESVTALIHLTEKLKSANESLLTAAEQFPATTLQCLATEQSKPSLISKLLKAHPNLSQQVELGAEQKAYLESLAAQREDEADAAPESSWPEIVRSPRWQNRKKLSLPKICLTPPEHEPKMHWEPGQREEWTSHLKSQESDCTLDEFFKNVESWLKHEVHHFRHLVTCPPTAAEELFERCLAQKTFDPWYFQEHAKAVVARWDLKALPLVRAITASKLADAIAYAAPFDDLVLCQRAAEAYSRLKSCRRVALAHLKKYPETSAKALLPDLLGKKKKQAEWAKSALLALNQAGFSKAIRTVAQSYGANVEQALIPLLELDELDILPAKMPELPGWLEANSLQKPILKSGGALTDKGLENFLLMLAISKPGEVYPGVAKVAEDCEPKSLARFAWSVFQAWIEAGADSKQYWCLHSLGWLGNDETVRKLTPLLKKWPGEGAHARAVQGLEVLTAIGTDIALMHLYGLSQKLKFKGLKNQAQEKVSEIAENRGLSTEELGDRLVPDLGLDSDGTMVLDYGPRRFVVGFDEKLKPLIRDESGKIKKSLPKPGKTDDSELATSSFNRFKALKKDARTAASQQLLRLEMGMVKRRRWKVCDFQSFFLQHPLVIHLTRRLVWGLYSDKELQDSFRIAEDGTLADSEDEEWSLPEVGSIGIVHPFDLTPDQKSSWSEILADYKILQPFAQLSREVFELTEKEKSQTELTRVACHKVESLRILSLESKGWRKGEALDGGVVGWMLKDLGNGVTAYLDFDPGLVIGEPAAFPEQTLHSATLHRGHRGWNAKVGAVKLGEISKAAMSEILRDLQGLT